MDVTSILYLVVTCHLTYIVIAKKQTLYIGGLFDLGQLESWKVIPAAQLAIDEINNNDYVTGYTLELLINDTRTGDFSTASGVHNYLNNGPRKIMLLGPIDNALVKSIAAYSAGPNYGILQFSYGTDDLRLANNRNLYPYFFRTAISMASFDDLRVSFIKHFPHWTEVGIIYGDNLLDAQLSNQLRSRLQFKGIKVLAEVRLQENDPGRAIRTIQEKDIHIIFGLFAVDLAARKLFCQAHKNGLYGPHYVWILQMASNTGWWKPQTAEDIGGCQEIEMTCQVQNYFHVKPAYMFESKTSPYSYSKKNTTQLEKDYFSRVDTVNSTSNRSADAWKVYDAVWSIAHVLKSSMSKLGKPLENVTYGDPIAGQLFYNETVKLVFESPNMKYVRYFKNGDRKFDMNLEQIVIKDGKSNPSGVNAGSYDFLSGKFKEDTINWQAGTPYRKTVNNYITRYIHRALFGALIFLACLGLLYALICLIIVIVCRKQPIIWNSGPIMNIIIILGCILNYITIILYAFDWTTTNRVTSLCRARAWTFAIGFTLSVGGLVAKLWIAYCVLSERFVRKWRNMLVWMLTIVFVLFIFDLIIMGCWEGIDPLFARKVIYKDQEVYKCFEPITEKTFQANFYTVEHCTCDYPLLWLLIILILKFLVVIFGVFLAWQTRKLYIKSLNDTQHCGFCLFVVFFFAIIGVLCALLTTKFPNLFFGILGTIIFLCTTIILGLLYIHKQARVVCKPQSGRVKTIVVGSNTSKTDTTKTADSDSECSCCPCCPGSWFSRCFSYCSCCACSGACCIACWSCFPCCNLFSCCKKCCCGTQVHPGKNDDGKTEFYINGQAQEREGKIAYLLRELHEREAELERLRPAPYATIWTQTYDDDFDNDDYDYSDREDGDGNTSNSDNGASGDGGKKRRRRKRRGVKIFSQGADYSHVQSRVDSRLHKGSPRSKRKQDEKYYLGVWQSKGGKPTDAEIAKLMAQLAEKDKEIERLKKERARKPSQPNKITIVNENGNNTYTTEKHCQTEFFPDYHDTSGMVVISPSSSTKSSPEKKYSIVRKTPQNEPKDKIVIVKSPDEKEVKKEKEKPVQSSAEWLYGKPEEKNFNDEKHTVVIVSSSEKEKNETPEEEKKKKDKEKYKGKENNENKTKDNTVNIVIVGPPKDDENPEKQQNDKEKRENENEKDTKLSEKEDEEKRKREEDLKKEKERKEEERQMEQKKKMEEKEQTKNEKEERKKREEEKKKKEEEERKKQEEEEKKKKEEDEERKKREEEERKKQEEEEKKKKEEEEERKKKEDEERKKQEEEEEKQIQERRKSRFSFFGRKESLPISKSPDKDKPHDRSAEPQKSNSPKDDKLEKPVSHIKNLDSPVEPESPKPETPEKSKSPNTTKNDDTPEEKQASPKPKQVTPEPAKDEAKQEDLPEDESPTRQPQNTPASVHRLPQEDDEKTQEAISNKPSPAEECRNNDEEIEEEQNDDDDDDEEEEDENDCDDEEGNDDNDQNDGGDDNDDAANKTNKPKRRRKRIGGKLNWNAESKIDNSSGYKKRPTKKIKTFKSDYSHVRSKLYGGADKNDNDKPDDNKDKDRRKPKRRVTRSRWNPNDKKAT